MLHYLGIHHLNTTHFRINWGGVESKILEFEIAKNPRFYLDIDIGKKMFEFYLENVIEPMKTLWQNKTVIVIEGKNSYFGVYNDLLESANNIIRISDAPSLSAFSKIDELYKKALKIAQNLESDDICFVLALGATAKILGIRLIMKGYKCFDMGNCSISYDCFRLGAPRKLVDTFNPKKYYMLSSYLS